MGVNFGIFVAVAERNDRQDYQNAALTYYSLRDGDLMAMGGGHSFLDEGRLDRAFLIFGLR